MLIYGAFQPAHRQFILVVAVTSKTVFPTLVLTLGSQIWTKPALPSPLTRWLCSIFSLTWQVRAV